MLSSLLTILALAYGGVAALLFLMQDKLAYYPQIGREIQTTPREHGLDYEALTLATADGEQLDAWFVPAPNPLPPVGEGDKASLSDVKPRGVVLILHGNAGNISHRMDSIAMFHRLGYGVLIFDYRGYGRSSGKPSEQGLYQDAQTAWDHLTRQRGIAPARIVLFGESLGGAVAAWLATREKPGALVLSSVFTSAPELGADLYPWLPTKWLVRMRYDTRNTLAQVTCPVLIAHSPDDEIVPFRHGQRLFDAAVAPKVFLPLTGGHNDSFIFMRQEWVDVLAEFLSQHIENGNGHD